MVKWIGFIILKCNLTPSFDAADMDCGEAAATIESTAPNARHTCGNMDCGEAAATRESTASNARHAIRLALVGHRGGDGDGAGVLGATRTFHLGQLGLGYEVIPDAVDLDFGLRTGQQGQQCRENEK